MKYNFSIGGTAWSIWLVIALLMWSSACLWAQQAPSSNRQASFPSSNAYAKAKMKAQAIPSEGNTWGYDILVEGQRFIHQPSKPGLPGNRGFATKVQALKVAELVIGKIRKGQMPPTVSIEEMKQLKAL